MSETNAQDRVAELELQLEEANQQLAAANEEIKKLQAKNAAYENPTFTHGNDEYEILVKSAKVPGIGPVTAADIAADTELQASLVAKQSGIIRKKA